MEKDKLDDFFNQKLPGRSFEPTEEYWKQAEALIEAQEKKRRNWKFLWWGLSIFLLLGFAIGWNWQSDRFVDKVEGNEASEVLTETTNSISKEVDSKETSNTLSEKEAVNNTNEDSNTDAIETDSKVEETSFATAGNNKKNTESNDRLISATPNKTQKSRAAMNKAAEQLALKNKAAENRSNVNSANQNALNNKKRITEIENKTSQSQDALLNNDSKIANSTADIQANSEGGKSSSVTEKMGTESEKESSVSNLFEMETLALTALPFSMEEIERELDLGTPNAYKSKYPQPRRRSFNLGVQGGVSLFPGKGNEKILNGWEGGLTAQYQLSKNWLIGADVLYLQNVGTFNQSDLEISELNYSFGSKTISYDFKRTSLSTAEVPLYVQYKMDKHRLEAGLGLNFLLGVRGALEKTESLLPWEREDIEVLTETVISEEQWVAKDGFKTFYPSLILGYRFEMTKRFDIGVRARYVWTKNESKIMGVTEGEPLNEIYQEFQPLSFRVNLRYYFIK